MEKKSTECCAVRPDMPLSDRIKKLNDSQKSPLEYFVGKLCTIICADTSLVFKDADQYYNHFLGFVEEINEEGILLSHLERKTKHYYFKKHVVAIIEERVVKEEVKTEIPVTPVKKHVQKPQPITLDALMKEMGHK